jgi:hypothetical protein
MRFLGALECLRKRVLGGTPPARHSLNLSPYKLLQVEKIKLKSNDLTFLYSSRLITSKEMS